MINVGDAADAVTLVAVQPEITVEPILIDASEVIVINGDVKNFNLRPYLAFFGIVAVFWPHKAALWRGAKEALYPDIGDGASFIPSPPYQPLGGSSDVVDFITFFLGAEHGQVFGFVLGVRALFNFLRMYAKKM